MIEYLETIGIGLVAILALAGFFRIFFKLNIAIDKAILYFKTLNDATDRHTKEHEILITHAQEMTNALKKSNEILKVELKKCLQEVKEYNKRKSKR